MIFQHTTRNVVRLTHEKSIFFKVLLKNWGLSYTRMHTDDYYYVDDYFKTKINLLIRLEKKLTRR